MLIGLLSTTEVQMSPHGIWRCCCQPCSMNHGAPGNSCADMALSQLSVLIGNWQLPAKRMGELHALSVHEECCRFLLGDAGVVLHPNPAFRSKVWSKSHASQSIELHPFHPPQDGEAGLSGQSLLCPIRALMVYLHRTLAHRTTDQLFVC